MKGNAVKISLAAIKIYQRYLSPLKPATCRFYPTCSQYSYDAIKKYGAIRGSMLGLKRLLKCHPFHPGGYDPVN
ncbi:MAG: membrane protein insertion efficiency factor YidD [Firmicutes bacterium]|nr:membrane protein insertion efficiency factor YidD [Bacillota bacterium]